MRQRKISKSIIPKMKYSRNQILQDLLYLVTALVSTIQFNINLSQTTYYKLFIFPRIRQVFTFIPQFK